MNKALEFLNKNIENSSTVICATSGGPDSMALLNLLLNIQKEKNLKIICAHVNHCLRKESDEEFEFVNKYANENNIIFEGTKFENYSTNNIESESHFKRYEYFENLINKYKASYLLTAHHGDDLIETILMKLTRGASLDSLIGIDQISDRKGYKILRPLIFYTKEDIFNYNEENNIEYRIDKTNFSDKYTRNRYRHNILPLLKKENKNIHLKYLDFSNSLKENNNYINKIVDNKYNKICTKNCIDLCTLNDEELFIQKKIIYKFLSLIYLDKQNLIEQKHILNIISMIKNKKPNLKLFLPNNIILEKKYNKLIVSNQEEVMNYMEEIKDEVFINGGIIKLVKETNLTNNYVCFLNSKDIKLPLYVRNRRNGDRITLLGLNKSKKIKDIFINEKVDIDKRDSYPLIVDAEDNVLWIPGLKKSKFDAIKTGKYDIILWYDEEEF